MDKIIVQGGNTRLSGEVVIEGAKNAVLPLLAATILASEGQTTLTNVPILSDVYTMNNVVRGLDIAVDFDEENNTVVVDASGEILDQAPYEYVSKMRASIVMFLDLFLLVMVTLRFQCLAVVRLVVDLLIFI